MIHYDHAVHVVREKRLSRTIPAKKPDKFFTHQNPSPYVDIVSMEETEPMPEPNDDRSRLDGAYRSEKPRLIARLRAAGRTLEEAEDLVHDVYAETMERLPFMSGIRNLPAWINALFTRRLIDAWRHERVRKASGETDVTEETLREIISATGLDPLNDYVRSSMADALDDAMRALPAAQRRVVEA